MVTIGNPFIELTTVDSTNIYAMQQAHARLATPGTVYFAHEQTAGKGQRNKSWSSEPGKNLTMSAVIDAPHRNPERQFLLSCSVALACYDFFSSLAGTDTAIKWPNDLYWNDRKAGGILIENIIRGGNWIYSVIGIGMNINQDRFDPQLKNPVSLLQITGKSFNIPFLARDLCKYLTDRLSDPNEVNSDLLLQEYNSRLYKRNSAIRLKINGKVIEGILAGADIKGNLVLSESEEHLIQFGTAEWLL